MEEPNDRGDRQTEQARQASQIGAKDYMFFRQKVRHFTFEIGVEQYLSILHLDLQSKEAGRYCDLFQAQVDFMVTAMSRVSIGASEQPISSRQSIRDHLRLLLQKQEEQRCW